MKKLSLLVAIAMLVTIGGVYATWNYAQAKTTERKAYLDTTTKISDKVTGTEKGTISVDTSGISLTIDDSDNDFNGELTIDGKVKVTFTPNPGCDPVVAANGIAIQYTLTTTENWNYNDAPIFNLKDIEPKEVVMSSNGDGTFSGEIDVSAQVELNPLYLPNVESYDAFKLKLHSGSIIVVVSEAPEASLT